MPSLIHLNGPPAIGKSTLSALWAERHPGTLNLDVDALHHLVGGWRDLGGRVHDVLRPVALAMASAHLAGGRDVVLPQCLTTVAEIAEFEHVARTCGAGFREVILFTSRTEALARFSGRAGGGDWDEHNRRVVAAHGGNAFLADLYDRLRLLEALRPDAIVVTSVDGAVDETYTALARALDAAEPV
nr:AAA family ATPase [Propionicimonas sp.]